MNRPVTGHPVVDPLDDEKEDTVTETQPGREPEQGAGPGNEVHEQLGHASGYADPSGQASLSAREPNDDLHGLAREVAESSEGPGPAHTPGA